MGLRLQNKSTDLESAAPLPDDTPLCKSLFAKQITYITFNTLPILVSNPKPIYLVRKQKVLTVKWKQWL